MKQVEPKPAPVPVEIKYASTDDESAAGQSRVSLKAVEEGAIPIDAVHDAQVHPNQRAALVNSQVLPVAIHEE